MKKSFVAFVAGSLGALVLGAVAGCSSDQDLHGRVLSDTDGGDKTPIGTDAGGGTPASRTPLGRACLRDSDCGGRGITCLTSASTDLFGGGPGNGLCVADCSASAEVDGGTGQDICDALDKNSRCVIFGDTQTAPAYCMQRCTVGASVGDDKCHGREDTACDDNGQTSFCRPICRNDSDCNGRVCDLSSGFCMDAKDITGTLPIGAPCDPDATDDPCAGACLPLVQFDSGKSPGMCAGFCSIGRLGCGTDSTTKVPTAACLFDWTNVGPGDIGDIGLCGQLCDCNDECTAYNRVCRPFPAAEVTIFGRKGYCGGKTDSTTGQPADNLACTSQPPDAGGGGPDSGGPTTPVDAGATDASAATDAN